MKKYVYLVILVGLVIAGCAKASYSKPNNIPVEGSEIITEATVPTLEECAYGGESVDLYIDKDNSTTVTELDKYIGSVMSCNGAPGITTESGCHDGHDNEDNGRGHKYGVRKNKHHDD